MSKRRPVSAIVPVSIAQYEPVDCRAETPTTVKIRWPGNAAFIEAVRTGDRSKIACTYADATQTTAISEAALESIASDQPVEIDAFIRRSQEQARASGMP